PGGRTFDSRSRVRRRSPLDRRPRAGGTLRARFNDMLESMDTDDEQDRRARPGAGPSPGASGPGRRGAPAGQGNGPGAASPAEGGEPPAPPPWRELLGREHLGPVAVMA